MHEHEPSTNDRAGVPIEPGTRAARGSRDFMEAAVRELLIETGLTKAAEMRRQIQVLDPTTPVFGANVVARAWMDPEFRARLLTDGRTACEEFGLTFHDDTDLVVLENDDPVHDLVVCTLSSCHPRPVLGLPPDWYKLRPCRVCAVSELRAVPAEFGTLLPADVEIRLSDSTAIVRYLVLPKRPEGTDDYNENELAALVTRDALIGVVEVSADMGKITP